MAVWGLIQGRGMGGEGALCGRSARSAFPRYDEMRS
jgi:hypothetical protein